MGLAMGLALPPALGMPRRPCPPVVRQRTRSLTSDDEVHVGEEVLGLHELPRVALVE